MKLLFSEHSGVNYDRYEFPYCVYCVKEDTDSYHDIYSQGFLPYTNELNTKEEIFYLARSVRIDLEDGRWNYKQNTVFNKFSKIYDNDCLTIEIYPKEKYINDDFFLNWSLNNAKNHFLSQERLIYILHRPYLKNIIKISYNNDILAFLFVVCEEKKYLHTWFSFYDLNVNENNFGKWILLKTIEWTKKQGYPFFYVGTCYEKKAFYKLTLNPFTKYFDGSKWNDNISELKKHL